MADGEVWMRFSADALGETQHGWVYERDTPKNGVIRRAFKGAP